MTRRSRRVALVCTAAAVGVSVLAGGTALTLLAADKPAAGDKPAHEGYTDTPMLPGGKWHVHDPARPLPPVVTPAATFSHMAPPPSDAVALFDGKDLSRWVGADGKPVEWAVRDGYAEATKGVIRTRDEFGDFQLHLEFATPAKVEGTGQGRGNNGLNIFGQYEIQILDSFENLTYADGQCAAIYGQRPPLVNASQKPGEWQTYDVVWEAPHWDGDGKLSKRARVTVLHNGVLVHHRQAVLGHTSYRQMPKYDPPHRERGPIELYYHHNPVRFRNIWIRPIEARDADAETSE